MAKAKAQVLRIEKRTAAEIHGARGQHARGVRRPPPDELRDVPAGEPAVVQFLGDEAIAEARAALKHGREVARSRKNRLGRPAGGRPPKEYFEIVIAVCRYDSDLYRREWNFDRECAIVRKTEGWLRDQFPTAVLASVTLHRDEGEVHAHLVGCARVAGGRVSVNLLEGDWCKRNGVPSVRFLTALQDSFYEDVARHFGLERGTRVSERHKANQQLIEAGREDEVVPVPRHIPIATYLSLIHI